MRCAGSGGSKGSSSSRSCGGGAVALPQQARVLVRHRRRPARLRIPRPGPVGPDRRGHRLPARLRERKRGPRAVVESCRAQGLTAHDRRTGEGLLRNLVVREGRRAGDVQLRLVTSPGKLDREGLAAAARRRGGLMWTQLDSVAETTQGGQTELLAGDDRLEEEIGGCGCGSRRMRSSRPTPRWPSGSTGSRSSTPSSTGSDRVYDLYCGIGTIGLLIAPRVGEVWGLEIVEDAIADAIANARANEIENARFFAGDVRLALGELVAACRPARPARRRPAARGPLAEDRAPDHRGRPEADRLRLVQPDDARAERCPARPGAATGCAGSDRSTCSRRRRTSSAWRCWSASRLRGRADVRAVTIRDKDAERSRITPTRARAPARSWSRSTPPGSTAPTCTSGAGLYPAPPGAPQDIPGLELAGEVVGVGAGATRFTPGDRVMAIVGGGGQAELAVVHERS